MSLSKVVGWLSPDALPLVLAALMTGLNALKPPCIDDTAYLAVARQIAAHPLDPYGFEQFWYSAPQPANEVLAPPVLPYWLGLGMGIIGERPVLLKLWLLPIALLLTVALQALLRRFARGIEAPLLVAITLSPAVLPGFNFMLDIPALALSLAAAEVMLRALDRDRFALAVAAGVIAGLAAQTKYTGTIVWPLLLLAAWQRRRLFFGAAAVAAAALLFSGWEAFIRWRYGESHFLFAVRGSSPTLQQKLSLLYFGLHLLGAVGPPVVLFGVAALTRRGWPVVIGSILLAAGWTALALVPDTRESAWLDYVAEYGPALGPWLFRTWGGILVGLLGWVAVRLLVRCSKRWSQVRNRPMSSLLVGWLTLEVVGALALTNFPATRRILGIVVVAFLLVAHLAARTCRHRRGQKALWLATAVGAALGLLYAGIDVADSRLEPDSVRQAAGLVREQDPQARVWFTGHWGTQYEAERLGLAPLIPRRSVLHEGDWLIDAPPWVTKQDFAPDERMGPPVQSVRIDRALRLRTLPSYYGAHKPMEWWPSPMIEVTIYRIRADWKPQPP